MPGEPEDSSADDTSKGLEADDRQADHSDADDFGHDGFDDEVAEKADASSSSGRNGLGVVIIDADASRIAALADALPQISGGRVEVVATATGAEDGLEAVDQARPDVVVLGLNLEGGSLELLEKLLGDSAHGKIVAVASSDPVAAAEAAALGAHSVVSGDTPHEHLLAPILGVVQGWRVLADPVVAELVAGARRPGAEHLADLDDEAVQLWMLVAEGLDLPTIAQRLGGDEAATKRKVSELRVKVGAANRTQLATLAGRAGLVDDGWLDGTVPGA